MNLQETIRRVLRETKEEKIRSFLFTRFDRIFNELNLVILYDKQFVNTMYGKWFNEEEEEVFHRNNWGILWVSDCTTYRKLRSYSSSLLLNMNEFEKLLIEYLNGKYNDQFKGKLIRQIGDEHFCLEEDDYLEESEEMSEMKEGELTEKCWKGYTQKGMKTMFGKRYPNCVKKKKIHEEINEKDAYGEYSSVKTIVDGKRNIAFTTLDNPVVKLLIKMNGLKKIKVESSDATNYVIYKEGSEKEASELVDIANKYGGTLNYEASEEDSRRIGQILGYISQDIDNYIQHNKKIRGISENNSLKKTKK